MKIGIFDSGIGGLSLLKEYRKEYPKNEYLYFGDNIHAPFGEKTKEELLTYAKRAIAFFEQKQVDKIVFACGTISSTIFGELTANVPIFSILEPTIQKLNQQEKKNLVLLATENTVKSSYFDQHLSFLSLQTIACSSFVPLLEKREKENLEQEIQKYCLKINQEKCDTVILGCTHYSFLKEKIKEHLKPEIEVVDLAEEFVKVHSLQESKEGFTLYFSKINQELKENIKDILGENSTKNLHLFD